MKPAKMPQLQPKQAVHQYCIQCVGGVSQHIKNCQGDQLLSGGSCPFYKYRLNKGRPPLKTIRTECLKCMGGSRQAVEECTTTNCPLHFYRFGTNPNRAGIGGWKQC